MKRAAIWPVHRSIEEKEYRRQDNAYLEYSREEEAKENANRN